jgi:zinc transporter 1/2/3
LVTDVWHSLLIGLTLAVSPEFKVLFVVLVFHRKVLLTQVKAWSLISPAETFEGLGIGSRLAFMRLPEGYNWVPIAGAVLYGLTTPLGIAVGLGVRDTYNPGSTTASIVSGVLDALSAGILMYTGFVEVNHSVHR